MKTNKIAKFILSGALAAALVSCNDFLDVQPDNRTTIDSSQKAASMLVSAYSDNQPWMFLEIMSDNCDDHGNNFPRDDQYAEEIFTWAEPTQEDNTSPEMTWEGQYTAIASANQVLMALDEMERDSTTDAIRGEALICRAYAHFVLVNIFCQHYDPAHPEDLGIPYMEHAETELNPQYERGTVHEVYALIEKDIEAGLPLINDAIYSIPKYHFNKRAAYAFAARFYLYYQKYQKAVECATEAISTNPQPMLRDYVELAAMPCSSGSQMVTVATYYTGAALQCNFLLATAYSQAGVRFGGYGTAYQYNHGQYIANTEGVNYTATSKSYPFASSASARAAWRRATLNFISGLDKVLLPHVPYLFEYTDPVQGIGYAHAVYPLFTADETLLTRAEAFIMMQDYASALDDMNLYVKNVCTSSRTMTVESVQNWAESIDYYAPDAPTPKKALNPAFTLDATQEAMIHTLLALRRYETLHYGLRWFDVKRFGIEIYRRTLNSTNLGILNVSDKLEVRDPRRAVQLPVKVISAGMEANPR